VDAAAADRHVNGVGALGQVPITNRESYGNIRTYGTTLFYWPAGKILYDSLYDLVQSSGIPQSPYPPASLPSLRPAAPPPRHRPPTTFAGQTSRMASMASGWPQEPLWPENSSWVT
jgi:hypothetical protein